MKKLITQTIFLAFLLMLCIGNLYAQETFYTITVSSNPAEYEGLPCSTSPSGTLVLEAGIPMSVVAYPAPDYNFINWTENGEEISGQIEYYFIVSEDRNLVANFAPVNYNVITLTPDPAEGGEVFGAGVYEYGTDIVVTATAQPNYEFSKWTDENGELVSTDPEYSFVVTENRALIAYFNVLPPIEITLSKNIEEGGTVDGAGIYSYGQTVFISAHGNLPEYVFENWTEDGNIVSDIFIYTFPATQSRHLVANFIPAIYDIPVYANPYEGGSVTGGGEYTYGDHVTISANANPEYQFLNWTKYHLGTGTVVSTEPIYTYELTGDGWGNTAFVAYFAKEIEVTVLINVPGGEVLGGGTYHYGDEVTVEAIPNPGYKFVNWTEGRGIISTENPYSFTVSESMLLIANFEEDGMISIESVETDGIEIFPNPTTGMLQVTSYELQITGIEISDIYGRNLTPHTSYLSPHILLDISDFPTGVYLLQLQTEKGIISKKFVKN